jgi:hypothetical protein
VAEAEVLRRAFNGWAANDARFQDLAAGNPLLAELQPLSKDLAALGNSGLQILDLLQKGEPAPSGFVAPEFARLEKPNAEVSLAATRPVKALLNALRK